MSLAITAVFSALIYGGLHMIDAVAIPLVGKFLVKKRIPESAPSNEKLDKMDHLYLNINKAVSVMFLWHCYQFVTWSGINYDFTNTDQLISQGLVMLPVHLVVLFVVFDFFYTLYHWAMHWPPFYPWVHKHHHKQHSCFRGNTDAINVHPFEYICGEYNHLWAFYLTIQIFGAENMHAVTLITFLLIGGFFASLNHTRLDIRIPYLYSVFVHDVHHAIQPRANYGQYTMFWDWVFGTFLPSDQANKMASDLQERRKRRAEAAAAKKLKPE